MLFHGLYLLLRMREVGILRGLVPPGLAKGDEPTHSPRSCKTKRSRKLLAPLKRVSVILSSRRVSGEKAITRATQAKKGDWEWGEWGGGRERCVGLHNTYRTMQPM